MKSIKPRRRARPPISPVLALNGVRQLHEELAIELLEAIEIAQLAVIAVADEHDRLPVDFVGEEQLAAEGARMRTGVDGIERRIAVRRDVLRDAADEHPRRERVGAANARDARDEQ